MLVFSKMAKDDAWVDPVVEAYKPGIDRTLIRENLKRSVAARLAILDDMLRATEELRAAMKKARR